MYERIDQRIESDPSWELVKQCRLTVVYERWRAQIHVCEMLIFSPSCREIKIGITVGKS